MLQHPNHFSAVLSGTAEGQSGAAGDPEQLLGLVLQQMLRKFDAIGGSSAGPWRRKLWAATLLRVLLAAPALLLPRLDEILNIVADVLTELDAGGSGPEPGDGRFAHGGAAFYLGELPLSHAEDPDTGGDTASAVSEAGRRREVMLRDWLYQVQLRAFAHEQLAACRAAVGATAFDSMVEKVEPAVLHTVQNQPSSA